MILRRRDDYARVLAQLGGQLFATGGQVDTYFPCGKRAKALIPRMGIYFACVLPLNHAGPCASGGNCFKHGPYVGDKCPEWPNCETGVAPTEEQSSNTAIFARIANHIRTAPERESAALRAANIRQACHAR